MDFIDICAGIGGFRNGLEQAGHRCVGYVEIDKYARKSYEKMYDTTGEWTATDVTKIKPNDIPRADLWCFGFPCQDISVAGSQKGLGGTRSGIFYSIIELLKGKNPEDRPEWILVENVKNLLSINGGGDFTEVLYQMAEAGYDVEFCLFNSKDFGVPQNRERVFIVGHFRERCSGFVLFDTGTGEQINRNGCEEKTEELKQIIDGGNQADRVYESTGLSKTITGTGGGGGTKTGYYTVPKETGIKKMLESTQHYTVSDSEGLSPTIAACDYKDPQKVAIPRIKKVIDGDHETDNVVGSDGVSKSLKATDYKNPHKIAIPCLTPDRMKKRQNGRRFKGNGDPMFTLTAQDKHGVLIYDGREYNIRRLTPRECFRLQGFSDADYDNAESVNSNTQLYKQAGNAVTVNVAKYIGERLKRANG